MWGAEPPASAHRSPCGGIQSGAAGATGRAGSGTLQTSGERVSLVLTHSGVRVTIPLNRSRIVDPEGRLGRQGVPPDHLEERTFEQISDEKDPVMERFLEVLSGTTEAWAGIELPPT